VCITALASDTGPLGSDPLGFDSDRDYSKGDHLKIAVANYARQLKAYETGGPGIKKANVAKLAREWNVAPQSIRNHFIKPTRKFRDAADEERRILLPGQERALLERCLFMDYFSIPPDREMIEKLATVILHSRLPGHPPLGHPVLHTRERDETENDRDMSSIVQTLRTRRDF
jgi:hypothetical protein